MSKSKDKKNSPLLQALEGEKKRRQKEPRTIYVETASWSKLEAFCKREGLRPSKVIQKLIDLYIE